METNSSFEKGSMVKYKVPLNEAERKARFVVTENKIVRVNMMFLGTEMPFPPVICTDVSEIDLVIPGRVIRPIAEQLKRAGLLD